MNRLQHLIVAIACLAFSAGALAHPRQGKKSLSSSSSGGYRSTAASGYEGQMAVSGALGFYGAGNALYTGKTSGGGDASGSPQISGLVGIGGDYEFFVRDDMSVGGLLRYYTTSETVGSDEYTVGLLTAGGLLKAYLVDTASWSGYAATGLGILSPTFKHKAGGVTRDIDVSTGFGFYFGLGVLYKLTPDLAIGVENMRMLGVGEKINGWPLDDFMVKGRFFFGG